MPLDHLRAVAQHHQGGYGAEAAGAQIDRRAVVDLSVDHRVHQPHHVRSQLEHGSRGLGIVIWPIVEHAEFGGGLLEVYCIILFVVLQVVVAGF